MAVAKDGAMNDYDLERIRHRILGKSMDFHVHNWSYDSSKDEMFAKRKSWNFLLRYCCGCREWVIYKRSIWSCTSCSQKREDINFIGWGCLKCQGLTPKE